ncbi:MAG: GNAT family protein [Patescibacteria group bacterium]|nr:GNAT family protein [Patescibacteria group bacterium]
MRVPILKGKNIVLRPLRLSDAPAFCRWFKNSEVTRFLKRYEDPPTLQEERKYIQEQNRKRDNAQWIIMTTDGAMIGTVGLTIYPVHRRAVYGIFIGDPRYWGQGLGTEAGRLAVAFAFRRLRLHRIELRVYAYNIRGMKSYKKIGFRTEGRLRDHLYRDGTYHDEIVMGILRSEFRNL